MIEILVWAVEAAAAPPSALPLDLNTFISGGAGASIMAAIIFTGKLILDRTIPSRSDSRASMAMVMEGLNNMVKVLQEEKISDAKRLNDKQVRIDQLEEAADKDYDRISELRAEIIDLRNRLAQKDRHIQLMVTNLRNLGAQVSGISLEEIEDDLEITLSPDEVKKMRQRNAAAEAEQQATGTTTP